MIYIIKNLWRQINFSFIVRIKIKILRILFTGLKNARIRQPIFLTGAPTLLVSMVILKIKRKSANINY